MKKLTVLMALLFAGTLIYAQSHVDIISQVGPNNWGYIYQAGAQSNFAEIYSTGSTNDGYVYQLNNGFGGAGLDASIFQDGNYNHGFVDQGLSGSTFGHDAEIDQDGNWNDADIWQYNGQPSTAYTRQLGDVNDADQIIYSDGQGNSSAYIWQEGDNNNSYQNLGMGNYVGASSFVATQIGNNNQSYQYIYSAEPFPLGGSLTTLNNYGTIGSYGNSNYAFQEMHYNAGNLCHDNFASIAQYNDWNQAWQWQTGTGHTSTVLQNGNSNWAQSLQN